MYMLLVSGKYIDIEIAQISDYDYHCSTTSQHDHFTFFCTHVETINCLSFVSIWMLTGL